LLKADANMSVFALKNARKGIVCPASNGGQNNRQTVERRSRSTLQKIQTS